MAAEQVLYATAGDSPFSHGLFTMNTEDGILSQVTGLDFGSLTTIRGIDFRSNGQLYALYEYAQDDGILVTLDTSTGETEILKQGSLGDAIISAARSLSFSPTGELYILAGNDQGPVRTLDTYDSDTGDLLTSIALDYSTVNPLALSTIEFAPDGTLYGTGASNGLVTIDLGTGLVSHVSVPCFVSPLCWITTDLDYGIDGIMRGLVFISGENRLVEINLDVGYYEIAGDPQLTYVSGLASTALGLPGDYNDDGVVNAADYTVWRETMSANSTAYDTWKSNFGARLDSESGQSTVPEPGTFALVAMALASLAGSKLRANHRGQHQYCSARKLDSGGLVIESRAW